MGGRALSQASTVGVADYFDADSITHHHDDAVRIGGPRTLVALPILVDGRAWCIHYAATRERTSTRECVVTELSAGRRPAPHPTGDGRPRQVAPGCSCAETGKRLSFKAVTVSTTAAPHLWSVGCRD